MNSSGGLDRRDRSRLADPPCPTCHAKPERVHVSVRSSSHLYFKCEQCGGVWDMPQPSKRTTKR